MKPTLKDCCPQCNDVVKVETTRRVLIEKKPNGEYYWICIKCYLKAAKINN